MGIKKKIIFILVSFFLISLVYALSPPSLPDHFNGKIIIDEQAALVGTEIEIYVNDVLEEKITTRIVGEYDLYVKTGNFGDEIKFRVNNILAGMYERQGGETINLDLQVWTDRDNDGVNDSVDSLIGDSNSVDNNFDNLKIMVDDSENLTGIFSGTRNIVFKDDTKIILDFDFDFDNNILNLFDLDVKKQSNEEGSILVRGMPDNVVKTVYVDKLKSESNSVCIKDQEILDINEISTDCNQENEVKLECPGGSGGYSCSIVENRFKIEGLQHSGVKEFYIAISEDNPGSSGGSGGGSSGSRRNLPSSIVPEQPNIVPSDFPIVDLGNQEEGEDEKEVLPITGAAIGASGNSLDWVSIMVVVVFILVGIYIFLGRKRRYKNVEKK